MAGNDELILRTLGDLQKAVTENTMATASLTGQFKEFQRSCDRRHTDISADLGDLFKRTGDIERSDAHQEGEKLGGRTVVESTEKTWDRVITGVIGIVTAALTAVGIMMSQHPPKGGP